MMSGETAHGRPGSGASGVTVSGGGRVAVGTLELFASADALEHAARALELCVREIDHLEGAVSRFALAAIDAPVSVGRAGLAVADSRAALQHAVALSGSLAAALRWAADAYGAGEAIAAEASRRVSAALAAGVGYTLVLQLVVAGPILALLGAGMMLPVAAGVVIGGASNRGSGINPLVLGHLWWQQRGILSNPWFVRGVRQLVSGLDYGIDAAGRAPVPIIRVPGVGHAGVGGSGPDVAAATVSGVGGVIGVLREGSVRVRRTAQKPALAVSGYRDRAQRIPRGPEQVRIDRYVRAGAPDRFEVYLGGTADFSPVATTEPWDLTSNVATLAGADSGAYRAVEQALADAGADSASPLVVTGYSHGGSVAAMLAASGDWDVRGVYTLGGPAAGVPVPAGTPWVAIEHTDDLVPALGGAWDNPSPVLVTREALAGGTGAGAAGSVLAAHDLSRYRDTAAILDGAGESRVVAAGRVFDDVGRGADRVESTWYQATRGKK